MSTAPDSPSPPGLQSGPQAAPQAARDRFCAACGAAYPDTTRYPRTCVACGLQKWDNPLPVCLVLLPVVDEGRTGLLVIRRAIPPGIGLLGLVGGFLEAHESWQQGAAREVFEEAGLRLDPAVLAPLHFASTSPVPRQVLLFSEAPPIDAAVLPPFEPNAECSERGLVYGPQGLDALFAFPLHAEMARRFFAARASVGPAAFRAI